MKMVNIKNLSVVVLLALIIVTTISFVAAEQINNTEQIRERIPAISSPNFDRSIAEDAETVEYTPTETTFCNDGICTKIFYSGVQNIYEDDEWKDVSQAKSLKDTGAYEISFLETDGDYPLTVLDYNMTSITLDLDHWSFFNDAVDIRIWKANESKEDKYKQDVMDGKTIESGLGSSYKDRFDKVSHDKEVFNVFDLGDKKVTYALSPGDIIEFGPNSTTVVLQLADSENLADTYIEESSPITNFGTNDNLWIGQHLSLNESWFMLKFNVTSIDTAAEILDANFSVYYALTELGGTEKFTIAATRLYDAYTWTETGPTWDTAPSSGTEYNASAESTLLFNSTTPLSAWYDFKSTEMVTEVMENGNGQNVSALFISYLYSTPSDRIAFRSRNYATTALRPKLQITYIPSGGPNATITYPTNGTTYPSVINHFNWTFMNTSSLEVCQYSLNGAENVSVTCTDNYKAITSIEGLNNIIFTLNDSNGRMNWTQNYFTQDLAYPEAIIAYPINGTNYSTAVNHFNWTITNTSSLDDCFYSINGTTNVSVTCTDLYEGITIADGVYNILFTLNDSIGQMNWTQNFFVRDATPPVINVTYPFGTITNQTVGNPIYFNWTAVDATSNLSSCWFNYNNTNTTVTCGDKNTTFVTNIVGQRNLTLYINDSVNNLANYTKYWDYKFLERSRTFNATSYETTTEGFILNMSSDGLQTVSASFWFNNTQYTATKTGGNVEMEFTSDVSHPWATIGNISFYWTVNHGGTLINTSTSYQDVQQLVMASCNSTVVTPFLNFTFKDEETDGFINASVESYDWVYFIGDGSQNKSFNFVNATEQESYSICAAPNLTFHNNASLTYKADGYPQRIYSQSADVTNNTLFTVLYLLSTDDGQYVTFQVQDTNSEKLNGVTLKIEKEFGGAWVLVEQTLTDSAGTATFFLNPDDNHRITATKDGYTTYISTIRPTQSIYTIVLEGGDQDITYSTFEGIKFNTYPSTGTILAPNTTYTFGFNVTDTLGQMTACKLEIRNITFDIIGSATGCNSAGGNISLALGTADTSKLFGHYYINYGDGYLLLKSNDIWWNEIANISTNGGWVWDLMGNYNDYEGWGDSHNKQEYNRITFFFILLIFFLGLFTKYTGMEVTDAGYTLMILTGVIIGFSITGLFTIEGVVRNVWLSKYYIAIMTTMLTGGFLINYWRVRAAGFN